MPLVSVIMPAFNAETYIQESIESALAQTVGDIEVLVADDASTDRTRDLVDELGRRDPRIRLLRTEQRGGPAAARNRAIKVASGRYISFLDSDDIWLAHKLEQQINAMEANKSAFSFAGYEIIDSEGAIRDRVGAPDVVTYHQLLSNNVIGCLTAIYDTAITGKVFAPSTARSDFGLWLRVLRKVGEGQGINEILARYRIHSMSFSARKGHVARQNWRLYRQEGFGVLKSSWYFSNYVMTGGLKTYFPKAARVLGVVASPPSTTSVVRCSR
jgi:teichuronic acid biosynthesis glycosyltransferase TuaG